MLTKLLAITILILQVMTLMVLYNSNRKAFNQTMEHIDSLKPSVNGGGGEKPQENKDGGEKPQENKDGGENAQKNEGGSDLITENINKF